MAKNSMTNKPTSAEVSACIEIIRAVADAIKELKSVPSGHLYAHLMSRISFEQYNSIIDTLKRANLVNERNHELFWIG